MKLRLNFDQAGTYNAMTHVLVLSAKLRRNERLWQTMDIGNMLGPTFDFKHFHLRNKITNKIAVLMIFIFLHNEKNCTSLYFYMFATNLLSGWL